MPGQPAAQGPKLAFAPCTERRSEERQANISTRKSINQSRVFGQNKGKESGEMRAL